MLADNQEQAFSVASPTAMFSALLRTCGTEGLLSQGLGKVGSTTLEATIQDPPDSNLTQVHVYTCVHASPPTGLLAAGFLPTYSSWSLLR